MTDKQALVSRSELRAALALACKITERRATCPILSNVALLSTGAALALQATDCDIQATFSLDGSFADDGFATTIAAHAFRDVEKKAPDSADATIATGADESRASIAFGALNIGIPSIDVTDWPAMTIEGEIRAFVAAPLTVAVEVEFITAYPGREPGDVTIYNAAYFRALPP